jgi:hypothetical protein
MRLVILLYMLRAISVKMEDIKQLRKLRVEKNSSWFVV